MGHNYYVYLLTNKNNSVFYIGVTNDLERRILEHKNKLIPGFTKRYNIYKLVFFEYFENVNDAIAREKQLKNWHRDWKINLIKKDNPKLQDLYVNNTEMPKQVRHDKGRDVIE